MKKIINCSIVVMFALLLSMKLSLAEEHDHKDRKNKKGLEQKSDEEKHKHEDESDHIEDDHDHKKEAEGGHGHEEEKSADGHGQEDHDHKEEAKGGHAHDEEEGESKNVGPEKGVVSFDEEKGFVLSKEAMKTFSVEQSSLEGVSPWTIPASAIVATGEDTSVYRIRNGFFKRIDIEVLSKNDGRFVVKSEDLKGGDEIATKGVGYIRIAEVDVTSGESGHHH